MPHNQLEETMSTVVISNEPDGVTVLTLNRPKTLNALNLAMTNELHSLLDDVAEDGNSRVVILTGAGRGFCSGHDFEEFDETGESVTKATYVQQLMASLVLKLKSLPQPVIAAVNGPAAGGGFSLALACDMRICALSARFNAAFINIGLLGTDMGISFLLPRVVGLTASNELMLTGRFVESEEALRLGIVTRVVPQENLLTEARALARVIISNSQLGVSITKRVMWANIESSNLATAMELENQGQVVMLQSEAHRQAVEDWRARRTQS